jgi:hypothetical protein
MDNNQLWEDFLNPEIIRPRLITASVYNFAYSIFKDTVINRIRDFYVYNSEEGLKNYNNEVLSLNKSPIYASLEWLKNMEAIEQNDIEIFNKIKDCRNELAHEIHNILINKGSPTDFTDNFKNLFYLFRKIEIWWTINIELTINPDYVGEDIESIDENSVTTGPIICLKTLIDIAITENKTYYNNLKDK